MRETRTIGCVVTSIADPFIGEIIAGVERTAESNGYAVLLSNTQADPDHELKAVLSFQDRSVDGVIVVASRLGAKYTPHLKSIRSPLVLINNERTAADIPSVSIDNAAAGSEVIRHLVNLAHRRIAYIGSTDATQSNNERITSYRDVLLKAGLTSSPDLVVFGDGKAESGSRAMRQLLDLPERPTAVFCFNDLTAIGAMHTIHQAGLRVPVDVSVVGFDDLPLSPFTYPPLTTMRQPMTEMGRRAMDLLLRLIAGEVVSPRFLVPGSLIVRSSTGVPRGRK